MATFYQYLVLVDLAANSPNLGFLTDVLPSKDLIPYDLW
jgi:hypothetical protein